MQLLQLLLLLLRPRLILAMSHVLVKRTSISIVIAQTIITIIVVVVYYHLAELVLTLLLKDEAIHGVL